jgi:amino acid transporter
MPDTPAPGAAPPSDLRRTIGPIGAASVMIGVIIGSGIFKTPAQIALELSSPALILALWTLGGLICLAGALTLAELAAMLPRTGGIYVFLREAYGPMLAFVFGWSYFLLIKPFAAGGIAFVFAEALHNLAGLSGDTRITVTVMLVCLTLVNLLGVGLATGVARLLTFIKFAALAAIIALAAVLADSWAPALNTPDALASAPPAAGPLLLALATVMSMILWTFDGWADVGAVAGEVKNPQRNLPRVFVGGTLAVILVYVLVNAAYFAALPLDQMRAIAQADPAASVAAEAVARLVGPIGAAAVLTVIMLSTLGSSHSSIMTGARVSFAQARDGLLFRFIGRVHPRFHTPDASLIAQLALSIAAVWLLGGFAPLADAFTFTMWIFYGLAGAAIFILRARLPDAPRPFRCPLYPLVPALFVASSAGMFILGLLNDTTTKLVWLAILLAGGPVFLIWRRLAKPAST